MEKKKIPEEIKDFYTGEDLRVDHFLIRCARKTDLFSHLDTALSIGVYDTEKLLSEDVSNYYRSRIKEYNYEIRMVTGEDKKQQKIKFKEKLEELKAQIGRFPKSHDWKYVQAKKDVKAFKKLGFLGYHEQRKNEIRNKLVALGDTLIESEEFTNDRNAKVLAFIESLPMNDIIHEFKNDWKEISSPKGYDKFFKISEKQFTSREEYLVAVVNKIKNLSMSKRGAFEQTMLECAAARAEEEKCKNQMLSTRINMLRNSVFQWGGRSDYPEVEEIALESINKIGQLSSQEMLDHSRLRTAGYLHAIYPKTISDLTKELSQIREQQM